MLIRPILLPPTNRTNSLVTCSPILQNHHLFYVIQPKIRYHRDDSLDRNQVVMSTVAASGICDGPVIEKQSTGPGRW
ncbi:hypothetical protein J6590_075041 [Homalodisca vitripennis]|nr:hypothetical protein J6590_075041 [Homalodisca vitripennis]